MTYPSELAKPFLAEVKDFETIVAKTLAAFKAKNPAYTNFTEADLLAAVFQATGYDSLGIQTEINERYWSLLTAFATGDALDAKAFDVGLTRFIITPAVPATNTTPAKPAIMESDENLRKRCFLAWHSLSASGSAGWYFAKALKWFPTPARKTANHSPIKQILAKRRQSLEGAQSVGGNSTRGTPGDVYLYMQVHADAYADIQKQFTDDTTATALGSFTVKATPSAISELKITNTTTDVTGTVTLHIPKTVAQATLDMLKAKAYLAIGTDVVCLLGTVPNPTDGGTYHIYTNVPVTYILGEQALPAPDASVALKIHSKDVINLVGLETYQGAPGGVPKNTARLNLLTFLDHAENRIICDTLNLKAVTAVPYQVTASLTIQPGNDPDTVKALAQAALETFVAEHEQIDMNIPLSQFYAVLQVQGVDIVTLTLTGDTVTSAGVIVKTDFDSNNIAYANWDVAYVPVATEVTVT